MPDSSYFRDRAEQALRLAKDSTDPTLIKSLREFGQENLTKAEAIDGGALGTDLEEKVGGGPC
jgi:hypothetical protein